MLNTFYIGREHPFLTYLFDIPKKVPTLKSDVLYVCSQSTFKNYIKFSFLMHFLHYLSFQSKIGEKNHFKCAQLDYTGILLPKLF